MARSNAGGQVGSQRAVFAVRTMATGARRAFDLACEDLLSERRHPESFVTAATKRHDKPDPGFTRCRLFAR
jgi:hypothetical protein